MGKSTHKTRMKDYYRIFDQIYENPTMSLLDIGAATELSRNTVSKYLRKMYANGIIMGPQIRMKPTLTYTEYVYLMNFADPWRVFNALKQFPHVIYHAMTVGDWNTLVITDRLMDFPQLVGFETMIYQGVRGHSYTPKVSFTTWDECFEAPSEQKPLALSANPVYKDRRLAYLNWGEEKWKLFYAFKYALRQSVTPVLKDLKIRYEIYQEWTETMEDYCTIHTGFYPEGYSTYLCYCFLFFSDYRESVKTFFSSLPTTTFITELDNQFLVFASIPSSEVSRKFFCALGNMKQENVIDQFYQTIALFHCKHPFYGFR